MHILFGTNAIDELLEDGRFTILELDTIQASPDVDPQPAFCVLTEIGLGEINQLATKTTMHQQLMDSYKSKSWDNCSALLEQLYGSWQGEVDSFYITIARRIAEFQENPPDDTWDGIYRPWLVDSAQHP